jgi:hypothetical protein
MTRRRKRGNYTINDRKLILKAATSEICGRSIKEKQGWLLLQGVHRPGFTSEPVSESAIKYWQNAHRKLKEMADDRYNSAMENMLKSPPSYRNLADGLVSLLNENTGSLENAIFENESLVID